MASYFNMLFIGSIMSINYIYIVDFAFMGVALARRCPVELHLDPKTASRWHTHRARLNCSMEDVDICMHNVCLK
jgi:hypothetical protein